VVCSQTDFCKRKIVGNFFISRLNEQQLKMVR
jgi:hypothetical protein